MFMPREKKGWGMVRCWQWGQNTPRGRNTVGVEADRGAGTDIGTGWTGKGAPQAAQ